MAYGSRPITQALTISGPSGPLEAILDTPADTDATHIGVVCHPHPLHGGTMTNKVAHVLAKAFNEAGAPAVRFNFRGVGASAGVHADGVGETDDALAVLDWAAARWPSARLWLAGFSFGGAVAIRAAAQRDVQRLVTVAPAVQRVDVDATRLPTHPWLLVQGDRDELVNVEDVRRWVQSVQPAPELHVLPGVDHFFHGRLNDLREVVLRWLRRTAEGSRE
jgi:uncharacterized protein